MSTPANDRPAGALPAVDVREFIDRSRFSPYQAWLLSLCFFAIFIDGYGIQSVAVAAPALKKVVGLSAAQLGIVFSANSLAGLFAGFGVAPFLHRFGRRPLMITSILFCGLLSFAFLWVESFAQVLAARFVSGFFLALAVNVTNAFAAEIAPKRLLATCVVVITTGGGLGVAATGFLSGWLLTVYGWQSIFYIGGVATLALALVLLFVLPESPRALALDARNAPQIRAFLRRVDPAADLPESARFYLDEENKPGIRLGNLLAGGRALASFGLWIGDFCLNFVSYVFMNWVPSLVANEGGGSHQAGNAVGWFKIGGIVGSLLCAVYIDRRRNPYPILSIFLLFGCISVLAMSHISITGGYFLIVILLAGLLLVGPQYASTALLARLFPTYVRTGGMAVTGGFVRSGAMFGPFVVGVLLQGGWNNHDIFQAMTVPILISAALFVALALRDRIRHAEVRSP